MRHHRVAVPAAILLGLVAAARVVVDDPARPAAAEASTCLLLGLDDLVARADLAVEARVTSKSAVIDASGRIATEYALTVDRTFVGVPTTSRSVRLPGGVMPDGRGLVLPGMPRLDVGESAIVFLAAENRRGERVPIGLAQGRLRVARTPDGSRVLESDLRDLEFVDAAGKPVAGVPATRRVPYDEAVTRIQAACARREREAREPRK